ncbi:type II toxin-antitoxin system Phd/YefM family antitoxin [Rhodoplanes roseus]|uniref:Antitoxin n=1 Tax=Rhodoplanes roseus TaxID=29409 RepID=A0A327KRV4_9BRAD|nr:type II toxin-antitoxin system Phd/YefM family antitoxin [Rhodoplanes roseus]RAI41680.1 hypothetical protein CH341_21180 [Rhodoplanes roseus]
MKSWSMADAAADISAVIDAALTDGPQRIERRDAEPVVVLADSAWMRLVADYPTMADLVTRAPIDADDLPDRRPARIGRSDLL